MPQSNTASASHMRILALDGDENACVASVRSLTRARYSVTVGATHHLSKAAVSRHCQRVLIHKSALTHPEQFIREVALEVAREPGTLVIAHTEPTTIALSRGRELLLQHRARLVLPSHKCLLQAIDKAQTTALAAGLGLVVPLSESIEHLEQARVVARRIRYPAVLKACRSEELGPDGRIRRTGRPMYARTEDEFIASYRKLADNGTSVLAQEFIEGRGAGYFVLMNHGELRAEFAHLRVRDVHPTGSGSAVRVSIDAPAAMREGALRLLQALDFHGVGMIEFRLRQDGVPVFIEVNPRFWNSLPLAIFSGMDFPLLLAKMAEQGDVEPQHTYRSNVRCRWIAGDCSHVAQVLRGKPSGFPGAFPSRWRTLREFFTPVRGTFHDLFALGDPLPELFDWLHYSRRFIRASRVRLQSHRDQPALCSRPDHP